MEKEILIRWKGIINNLIKNNDQYNWRLYNIKTDYLEKTYYISLIYRKFYSKKLTIIIEENEHSDKYYICNKHNTYDLKRFYNQDENIEDTTILYENKGYIKVEWETGKNIYELEDREKIINTMLKNFNVVYVTNQETNEKFDYLFDKYYDDEIGLSKLLILCSIYSNDRFIKIYERYAYIRYYFIYLSDCYSIWNLKMEIKIYCLEQLKNCLLLENIMNTILKNNHYTYKFDKRYLDDYLNNM